VNKSEKVIFIYATALTSGGGRVIFEQFLKNIQPDHYYYIFSSDLKFSQTYSNELITFVDIPTKSSYQRLYWDFFGVKKWSKRKKIVADLVISLQSSTIGYANSIPQLVYLHNSVPFHKKQWNPFKKSERSLWFYRNVYRLLLRMGFNNNTHIVVQTQWIKDELIKQFQINPPKIRIIKPEFEIKNLEKYSKTPSTNTINILYPATGVSFKNHKVIIEALSLIQMDKECFNISQKIKLQFTFRKGDYPEIDKLIVKFGLKNNVEYLGVLSYEEMMKCYQAASLVVFPSYIETFGLPLLEAASFGLPIVASDTGFAREVLENYDGVEFASIFDANAWKILILGFLKKKQTFIPFEPNYSTSWKDFFSFANELLKY
jgi:glycosyltransferase involved in cell wall biosynthesis